MRPSHFDLVRWDLAGIDLSAVDPELAEDKAPCAPSEAAGSGGR